MIFGREMHAILLLDAGQNLPAVSRILQVHTNALKRWVQAIATGGEAACSGWTMPYVLISREPPS